jgi:hypothetical protein
MKFLPTENITYKTKLKEDEIVKRLSDIIETEKIFRSGIFSRGSTKSYQGQIHGQTFKIQRIISYRNSFLPRINGVIERDSDGMAIKVKMKLHTFVIVFLSIWCGGVGLGCLAFLSQVFSNSEFIPATLISFGMLLFVYLLTMGCFKFESNKSKMDLQTIFEADILEE